MRNTSGGETSAPTEGLQGAIVSDLMSLLAHVQASMELIEQAIPAEAPLGYWEIGSNTFVLDDVTPRYARARAALQTSEAHLGAALLLLHATRTPQPGIKAVVPRHGSFAGAVAPEAPGVPTCPLLVSFVQA